jgi:uncharacterized protein (TIGR00255 family)
MFVSMTGSATKKVSSKWGDFTFILNSFNHRFLEIHTNLPDELKSHEVEIQKLIRSKVSRGHINFHLEWEPGGKERGFLINNTLLENYYKSLEEAKRKLGLKQEVGLSLLMQLPDVLVHKKAFFSRNLWTFLRKNISLTLKELIDVRKKEGKELQQDIKRRTDTISKLIQEIEKALPKIIREYRGKLEQKLSPIANNENRERITQEVLLQAGRIDITEEMTRVSFHLKMFVNEMKKKISSGKRMDFICQEMLREINTMGSKIGNADISSKIVDVKTELDKIREQLRNVE